MKILSVNSGSSSLKFKLFEMPEERVITSGIFERIGEKQSFYKIDNVKKDIFIKNYKDAINILFDELIKKNKINDLSEIKAIGHRIVHGGPHFTEPVLIDETVLDEIEKCIPLAPLHDAPSLDVIKSFITKMPNVKNIAVFDTSFNQTIEKKDYLYAVPYEWYEKYGIRKYGFHGISYKYLTDRLTEILNKKDLKLIICHLGNGASVAAIKNGKVIANSMGFSPSTGLIMGSRAGDFDFMAIPYLMEKTNMKLDDVLHALNHESGLLGISEISNDSRDIEKAIQTGNEKALLARDMYIDKVVSYIASYYFKLKGVDAICFSAGIGQKSPYVRKLITDRLDIIGVKISDNRNKYIDKEVLISTADSKIPIYVLPTNEELMIARETYELVR